MSADKVQDKPVVTAGSKDVFSDLLNQKRFDGQTLISGELQTRLAVRIDFGQRKYGSRLMTYNGRDVLLDIEQELLDGIQYSHQAVMQDHRVLHIRNGLVKLVEQLLEYRRITEGQYLK